jgi:DNA-binding TFAR19-related protein (PDSD5 family)
VALILSAGIKSLRIKMSDSADQTYEELSETIATLRADKGKLENKVLDLEAKHRDLISELSLARSNYLQLVNDSLKTMADTNRVIVKLVDKIDGGSTW